VAGGERRRAVGVGGEGAVAVGVQVESAVDDGEVVAQGAVGVPVVAVAQIGVIKGRLAGVVSVQGLAALAVVVDVPEAVHDDEVSGGVAAGEVEREVVAAVADAVVVNVDEEVVVDAAGIRLVYIRGDVGGQETDRLQEEAAQGQEREQADDESIFPGSQTG